MKKLLVTPEGTFELELTSEEIIQKEKEIVEEKQFMISQQNRITQEKARKESAIAKLKALGLTEEEVKSIL